MLCQMSLHEQSCQSFCPEEGAGFGHEGLPQSLKKHCPPGHCFGAWSKLCLGEFSVAKAVDPPSGRTGRTRKKEEIEKVLNLLVRKKPQSFRSGCLKKEMCPKGGVSQLKLSFEPFRSLSFSVSCRIGTPKAPKPI